MWEPLQVGSKEIRNRVIMPAMHLNASDDGSVNDKIIEFYRRRAEGGAGMIIVGGIGVSKRGQGVPMMISIYDDKFIPSLQQLTEAVHKEGAKIIAQLYHAGAYAYQKLIGEQAVSSSAVFSNFTHETPRELTTEEVEEVIDRIAAAAERAEKAGFDGVEILSSAGYLIDQFLSPLKNQRNDRFGGSTLEERLTFPIEIIRAIKKKVSSNIIVGARLSGDDFIPGSNTYKEKKLVAQTYEKEGLQYLNVTGGWHETRVPQIPMDTPIAAFAYLAKEIHNSVKIPVFASNRINDPEVGENLLQDFYADGICFGRALIADPDLPNKIKGDQTDSIRKCVGCNQGCFDAIFNLRELKCMVNPTAMAELRYQNPKTTENPKKVIIIGSGPAGLEAARVAHDLGHKVEIYESSDKLGGQINVAWVPPGREDLKNIITWYEHTLRHSGIAIHLNSKMTASAILEKKPDVIFLATGVHFNIPPIPGIHGEFGSQICFADDALAGDFPVGKRVVVIGGAATGVETALWARKKGALRPDIASFLSFYKALSAEEAMTRTYAGDREVYILEYLPKIGSSIGKSTRWVFLAELKRLGITVYTNKEIEKFNGNTITFHARNESNAPTEQIDNIDTFILATGVRSNSDLEVELKEVIKQSGEKGPKITLLGDAKKVGTILDAIHSGFKYAYKLNKVKQD